MTESHAVLIDEIARLRKELAEVRESLRVKFEELSESKKLLTEWADGGPYMNDDAECSLCGIHATDDGDISDNPMDHGINCLWGRTKEYMERNI